MVSDSDGGDSSGNVLIMTPAEKPVKATRTDGRSKGKESAQSMTKPVMKPGAAPEDDLPRGTREATADSLEDLWV